MRHSRSMHNNYLGGVEAWTLFRLDMNHVIKVADFGLSVSLDDEKNYFRPDKDCGEKLPIKWMAPESLLDHKFSEFSDVVSHGICRMLYLVSAPEG